MVTTSAIKPSTGSDSATLTQQTTDLVDHGRWRICNDGKGLEREFKFKTFKAAWVRMISSLLVPKTNGQAGIYEYGSCGV